MLSMAVMIIFYSFWVELQILPSRIEHARFDKLKLMVAGALAQVSLASATWDRLRVDHPGVLQAVRQAVLQDVLQVAPLAMEARQDLVDRPVVLQAAPQAVVQEVLQVALLVNGQAICKAHHRDGKAHPHQVLVHPPNREVRLLQRCLTSTEWPLHQP